MKDKNEVIQEFNELVNMTASELEKWLKSDDSNSAGWPKEDENGESVGHDSGRKIVEILKDNPDKDPEKYSEDQVSHMRKVVSYCKRHLAQESKTNEGKSAEEVKKTKSYASLMNWGHDFLKAKGQNGSKSKAKDEDKDKKEAESEEKEDQTESAGDKRKNTDNQSGSNKKQETAKGESKQEGEEEEKEDDDNSNKNTNGKETNGKSTKKAEDKKDEQDGAGDSGESGKGPKKGDTVSWNWGGGQPEGKVLDVKEKDTSITTKNGNEVSRKGDSEDPAVVLDTGKSKAIKSSHELNET